jgi:hypothetical protein
MGFLVMLVRKYGFKGFVVLLLYLNLMGDTFQYNFSFNRYYDLLNNDKIAIESSFLKGLDKHILEQNEILDEKESAFLDKLTTCYLLDDTLNIKLKNIFLAMSLLRSINIPINLFDFFRYMDTGFSSVFECKKIFLLSGYNISEDLIVKKIRHVVVYKNMGYYERDLLVDLSQKDDAVYHESGPYQFVNYNNASGDNNSDNLNDVELNIITHSIPIPIPKLPDNNFTISVARENVVSYDSLDMNQFILDNFNNDTIAIVGRDYNDIIKVSVVSGELYYIQNNLNVIRAVYFNLPDNLREQYIINVLNICKLNADVKNILIKNFKYKSVQFMLSLFREDELNSLHLDDSMILNLTEYNNITLERIMFFRKILSLLKIIHPNDYVDILNNLMCLFGDKFEWNDNLLTNLDIYNFIDLPNGINFDECIKKDMGLFCDFFIYGKYEKQKEFLRSSDNKNFLKNNFHIIIFRVHNNLLLKNDIETCLKVYCYADEEMCDKMLEIIFIMHEERLDEVLSIAHQLRLKRKYDWFKLNYLENIINKYIIYNYCRSKFLKCINKKLYIAIEDRYCIKIIKISDTCVNIWNEYPKNNRGIGKKDYLELINRNFIFYLTLHNIKTRIRQILYNINMQDKVDEKIIECMA